MALKHGVAFPVANRGTMLNLFWAALNSDPIRDFTEARFLRSAFATTVIPVPAEAPKATTQQTITMDQVIDPMVTDLHRNVHTAHKACNLLGPPMFLQPFSHPIHQPLHSFVALEGGFAPAVGPMLRHLWFIAMNAISSQLTADRDIVAAQHCCDVNNGEFCQPHTGPKSGIVVFGSVVGTSSSLLHFGRKAREGTGDSPPTYYLVTPKCCSYYLNSHLKQ